ncbi:hypothetical protein ACFPMF_21200 [Larkinella bovis]|uniref:DUF2721 domain-containing protein n=1 Tax=Larkinella bovis TaxID=683041 RepID=A0ABW0IED7_9BACT
MTLEELKSTWKTLDDKLSANRRLSEEIVFQLIKDRSKSTLAKMERRLLFAGFIMTGLVLFFGAAMIGNAFDYTSWYFHLPSVLYISLALVALTVVARTYRTLHRVNLSQQTLYDSLKTVLQAHEKAQAALARVWLLCMLAGFLFGVSMVARKFEAYGMAKTSGLLVGQAVLILLLYAAARWIFTLFEDRLGQELRENLQELDSFKAGA